MHSPDLSAYADCNRCTIAVGKLLSSVAAPEAQHIVADHPHRLRHRVARPVVDQEQGEELGLGRGNYPGSFN